MTSQKPLSEGRKKRPKLYYPLKLGSDESCVGKPLPCWEPGAALGQLSALYTISALPLGALQGVLHYLASLAWGRAWELAWLLWWWSPRACQSNRPNQSLQERRDCHTPVCGDSTRLLAHTPLCGCCAMVLHHCQGLPHQAGAGKGMQALCCSVVTYHKSFRKAWPPFQSPHPSCGCCPAPAIPK